MIKRWLKDWRIAFAAAETRELRGRDALRFAEAFVRGLREERRRIKLDVAVCGFTAGHNEARLKKEDKT